MNSLTIARLLPALAALLTLAVAARAQEPARSRPNILLVVTDDQSPFDLRVYEPTAVTETPTLDRLAREGVTLTRAYHMGSNSGAVCTPSRHMIMSGRTLWHLPPIARRVRPNPHCPEGLAEQTLAAVFGRAGYDTMRTCKRGNSYAAANAQFAVRHEMTRRKGDAENGSAWHADRVLDFLSARAEAGDEDPFLVYLGFSHPHDPRWGDPELLAKYGAHDAGPPEEPDPKAPPLPPNYLPAHPFPDGHPKLRDEVAVQGVMERRDAATVRNEIGRQAACAENIDRHLGRVLAHLEESGELENTFVVFTSDHGIAVGRHGLMGKQNLYEHSWRVPLVVRGPGLPAGRRAPGDVYLLDLLATLCDLSGVAAPPTNEGQSFAPVLRGESESIRDLLFGVYCGGTKPGMRSVRHGDWKLVEWDVLDGAVRETQLFNLRDNPWELVIQHHAAEVVALTGAKPEAHQVNLADDPAHAERLAELRGLLRAEMERLHDPYPLR